MFFPKKLTFLQYWVYIKTTSIESTCVVESNYQKIGSFQQAKTTGKLSTKQLQLRSLQRQESFCLPKGALEASHKYSRVFPNHSLVHSMHSVANSNTIRKPQVTVGRILAQPKPWYSYWILPFVGFITVLPNLIPFQGSKDSMVRNQNSYGFKYLKPVEITLSARPSGLHFDTRYSSLVNGLPSIQVSKRCSSVMSTKVIKSFPPNLRKLKQVNASSFSKPVWWDSGTLINRKMKGEFAFASKKLEKYSLCSSSIKISNVISSATSNDWIKDLTYQLASQHKIPVISYKTLETSFDLLLKQLLFSKEIWFQKAFFTKVMSANFISELNTTSMEQGTNSLLSVLKKGSPRKSNIVGAEHNPQTSFPASSINNAFRFLTSYQDALYLYTYISNIRLDPNLGDKMEKSAFVQAKTGSFIPVKSSMLTKLNNHNQIPTFHTTFAEGKLRNQSQNITPTGSWSMPSTSYGNSFDFGVMKNTQNEDHMLSRQPISTNNSNSVISKNVDTNIASFPSYDITVQKYIHYIKSRLFTSLQSIKYRQDNHFSIQPALSLTNKTSVNSEQNQLTLASPGFQPLVYNQDPQAIVLLGANKAQTDSVKMKYFSNSSPKMRKSSRSKEKLIRNLSFYSAKSSKNLAFSVQNKKHSIVQQLNSKQLQRLLRNVDHNHSKKSMMRASQLLSNKILTLNAPVSLTNLHNYPLLKSQKQLSDPIKNIQPADLLRIKHFVFLSNREKIEYKHYRTLEVILKDEKLLYETLIRQNQKQKRRKKKRKRWTRRRRKRKRKLLRPIWTTMHLAKVIYQRRLAHFSSASSKTRFANQNFTISSSHLNRRVLRPRTSIGYSHPIQSSASRSSSSRGSKDALILRIPKVPYAVWKLSMQPNRQVPIHENLLTSNLFETKQFYKLSKKSLGALTNNKRYKTKIKTVLKAFEKIQIEKTKSKLNKQVLQLLTQGYPTQYQQKNLNFASSKSDISAMLEYNRIMYERLQGFLMNYGTNIDKNWQREQESILPPLASAASYSKVNSLHTKIINNAPKEEWLWLFKYITGEIPPHPINSSTDQLRSIWAMSKLQSTNQWTGWKNFYYQEFKKGLTPTYELWQDKKPDKRYNVNNLKKRQYKHIKQLQRLRLASQLNRGTYFALQRDLTKLTVLGSPYKKTENTLSDQFFVNRPIDKLRLTLKSLKTVSSYSRLKETGQERNKSEDTYQKMNSYSTGTPRKILNYQENAINHESISQVISSPKKPILDLYATWWDTTETTGWGWKTLQYGAPWDRKTLYIPTKLTSNISINYSPIVKESFSLNSTFKISSTLGTTNNEVQVILLVATILLHICAFLGLFSLAEIRYSTKVNFILAYKLSTIPLKIINTAIQPLFKQQATHQETSLGSRKLSVDSKSQNILLNYESASLVDKNNFVKLFSSTGNLEATSLGSTASSLTAHATAGNINSTLLNTYKLGFYGSLKQLVKKGLRHKQTQNLFGQSFEGQSVGFVATELTRSFVPSQVLINELGKLERRKIGLQNTLIGRKLRMQGLKLSYSMYYSTINLIESFIDNFRDTTRSVYDFFSLPENFSPNPDEVGLDVLANFIYDFEEPLIELLPDIIETQTDKYLDRYLLTLSLLGPFGLFVQQRCKWFYRMFIGLLYEADADYRKDEEELHILYTIWAEVLNKAAEDLDLEASVIASQEDQRILLLEHLLVSNLLEQAKSSSTFKNSNAGQVVFDSSLTDLINPLQNHQVVPNPLIDSSMPFSSNIELLRTRKYKNTLELFKNTKFGSKNSDLLLLIQNIRTQIRGSVNVENSVKTSKLTKSSLSNSQFVATWGADQYVLYKTDETDLFIEMNVPKSFATLPGIKHWDTLHQPIGVATCQIYSGILIKQMAKNILLIADNTAEKTQILQALAGETEVKFILDNSSRYASISQSVAVGMRLLRDVFDAVALQTPCIFVLEDIHLIGEKRPFLISDEDLALVTSSGLGLEQHQLYEKIQKIQQHSKHRISYFKKAYRGDAADSLPTNLLCYELFITDQPRTEWRSSNYPIPIDFHSDLNDTQQPLGKASQLIRPGSHLLLSETLVSHDTSNTKISHFVTEPTWSTKLDENLQKNNTISSLRGKVSSIADGALANISVKLDRITQLLVIMDNVRKNKGFIVFGTTNKPQILDPALRRPGRLEETIYLPSIPNILTKWEIFNSQMKSTYILPSRSERRKVTLDMFSIYSNLQKNPTVTQRNLVLDLAQCLPNQKRATTQTPYRFAEKTHNSVQKQKSIFKMQFLSQLLTESKTQTSKIHQIVYSDLETQKAQSPNIRLTKFLNEVVCTSYEQTAKSLFEIITHQRSTSMLLFKYSSLKKQLAHMEDTIYLKLYSGKELFKNELSFVFAGIIANYFATLAQTRTLRRSFDTLPYGKGSKTSPFIKGGSFEMAPSSINSLLDTTKDHNWQTATSLIYSYIQKRAIYNKNTYIQKLFNRHSDSISGFASPPTTALLLPAKRYENYLRAERDFEQTSLSQRTLSVQNQIEFHLNQRVLKRLYRLPIKEFYKSEIIEKSLTTFSSSNLVLPKNTRNFVQQNMQSKSNFYYRNIFLNRHRHYLTNQWWTGQLTEYNIENTVMSEIDFRSYFVDKTKVIGFTGDLILDFPDADQHYNLKHRRWYLQSTSWKSWYDLEKGLTTDIMNHYIVEVYTQTYRILNNNRELLDHYVSKLLVNYQLHEIDLISNLKHFT